ncbi:MAG: uroporphyrinogen-III synthase [Archangium sp.]|nr:uroporphyrinogen-III synthase [Archangium sp.]
MGRVLLLTEPGDAEDLAFLLGEEGHDTAFLPVLPRAERSAGLRSVAETLSRFTWVIALDRAVLRAFLEVVNQAGTRSQLARLQWLASDALTARVIERSGGLARIPFEGKWTAALNGLLNDEDQVLILHRDPIPELLLEGVEGVGAQHVAVEVQVDEVAIEASAIGDARVVIVHSASAAEAWAELTRGESHEPSESCCGPERPHHDSPPKLPAGAALRVVAATNAAAESLRERGVDVHATAANTSTPELVDTAIAALNDFPSP